VSQPRLFDEDGDRPSALVVYTDGGARGNPGPAGFGVRIEEPDGTLVEELSEPLGIATNNIAEYRALVAALEHAASRGATTVAVRSDSELMVKQMRGEYRVKSAGLRPLYEQATRLAAAFARVTFEHIPRSKNAHADRLANLAMDRAG